MKSYQVAEVTDRDLSIVIPVSKKDQALWKRFLEDTGIYENFFQKNIFFIADTKNEDDPYAFQHNSCRKLHWVVHEGNRAQKMNAGLKLVTTSHVLFLHIDSIFLGDPMPALQRALYQGYGKLWYFDLRFGLMEHRLVWNAIGANFRSYFFKMPFGDQGFLISVSDFQVVGPFNEEADYGEDHLFVWQAKRGGLKIESLNHIVFTSGRKYYEQGWLKVTLRNFYRTWAQAIPEFLKYIKFKISHRKF